MRSSSYESSRGRIHGVVVALVILMFVSLSVTEVDAQQKNDNAVGVGKAAGIGALIGFALGGDPLQGAAGGAALGAAGGLIANEVTKGKKEKASNQQARDDYKRSKQEQELAAREARIAALEADLQNAVQAVNDAERAFIAAIGPDNWEGYKALRGCQDDRANAYAAVAATSTIEDFRITSIYLRAAVEVDRKDTKAAQPIFAEIAAADDDIDTAQQASLAVDQVVLDMRSERRDLGIVCR